MTTRMECNALPVRCAVGELLTQAAEFGFGAFRARLPVRRFVDNPRLQR